MSMERLPQRKSPEEQAADMLNNMKDRLSKATNEKGRNFILSSGYTSLARLVGGDKAHQMIYGPEGIAPQAE